MSSRKLTKSLKKLFGGVVDGQSFQYDPKTKEGRNDASFNPEQVKATREDLKSIRDKLADARDNPKKIDKVTGEFVKSCRAVGLHNLPPAGDREKRGILMEILQKGNIEGLTNVTYIDPEGNNGQGELVMCVNEKEKNAFERFLSKPENIQVASARLDDKFQSLLTKIDMLEKNMNMVQPFVVNHPKHGRTAARLKLKNKDGTDRMVKGADGDMHPINTCQASTSRASCEAKRDSIYGEPDACLWMPNYSHLTDQAQAWEKETDNVGVWKGLQNEVCVPRDEFPFPMRPVTDADMRALRSGRGWAADKRRAVVERKDEKVFRLPEKMRNPISSTATFGREGQAAPSWSATLGSWVGLGSSSEPEKTTETKQEEEFLRGGEAEEAAIAKHYEVDSTASMYHSITGKLLDMPYFFATNGNFGAEIKPVPKRTKGDFVAAQETLAGMFRAQRRRLPDRLAAKFEKEKEKQDAIRERATRTLYAKAKQVSDRNGTAMITPSKNEIEDEASTMTGYRAYAAILQRLIYELAARGAFTEDEVKQLLREDNIRRGGKVIIVSTEPGMCDEAYKGISSKLDEEAANKIFTPLTYGNYEMNGLKGNMFGHRAGNSSLGSVLGVADTDEYKAAYKARLEQVEKTATTGATGDVSSAIASGATNAESIKNATLLLMSNTGSTVRGAVTDVLPENMTRFIASKILGYSDDHIEAHLIAKEFQSMGKSREIRQLYEVMERKTTDKTRERAKKNLDKYIKELKEQWSKLTEIKDDGSGEWKMERTEVQKELESKNSKKITHFNMDDMTNIDVRRTINHGAYRLQSANEIYNSIKSYFTVGEEEYLVGGAIVPAPPADRAYDNIRENVVTVLRGGGELPHSNYGALGDLNASTRAADTADNWGLTKLMTSTVKDRFLSENNVLKASKKDNTCLHQVGETALILMKANMPKYLPMIQRYYQRVQKIKEDSSSVLQKSRMTTSVTRKKLDQQVKINEAINNLTDEERFIKHALFDVKGDVTEDVLEMFPQIKAKRGVGSKLSTEDSKTLSGNDTALKAVVRGATLAQRANFLKIEGSDTAKTILETGLTAGLPWPVWANLRVLKALRSQKLRGKKGVEGKTLLSLFSESADIALKSQDKFDELRSKTQEAKKANPDKKWEAASSVARKYNLNVGAPIARGTEEEDVFNRTMDEIDATRIMLSMGQLGRNGNLAGDDMLQAAFKAFLRREQEYRSTK